MEINTFSEYLKEPYSLTMAQMQQFHEEMVEEIGNDPDARELYDDLVDAISSYNSNSVPPALVLKYRLVQTYRLYYIQD